MSGDALTCLVLGLRWAAKVSQEGLNLLVQVQEMGRNLRPACSSARFLAR